MLPFWRVQLHCRTKGPFQEFTCYQMTQNCVQGRSPQWSCQRVVHSFVRKVTSFWLNSKERKLACFQVGYPDWKSAPTFSFAPSLPSFWCKFLKEECGVYTCWFAHTQCDRHMIYFSHPAPLRGPRGGGDRKQAEKTGSSSWKIHIKC